MFLVSQFIWTLDQLIFLKQTWSPLKMVNSKTRVTNQSLLSDWLYDYSWTLWGSRAQGDGEQRWTSLSRSREGDQTPPGSCLHSELLWAKRQGKPPVSWRCSFWEQDWRVWTTCKVLGIGCHFMTKYKQKRTIEREGKQTASVLFFQEVIYFYIMDPFLLIVVCSDGSASSLKLDVHYSLLFVVQLLSRVRLCDPMDCSTPAFPALHHLSELAQSHVHWVGDASHVCTCVVLRWDCVPHLGTLPPNCAAINVITSLHVSSWGDSLHGMGDTFLLGTPFSFTTIF